MKQDLKVGEIQSLAECIGKQKYSGLLIKRTVKGFTYYMKYRDENNKVVKKAIKGIDNITDEKAYKEFSRVKNEIEAIRRNRPLQIEKKSEFTTLNEMAEYYFHTHSFKSTKNEQQRFNKHCRDEEFSTKLFSLVTLEELTQWVEKLKKKKPSNINDPESNKTLSAKSIKNILTLCISIVKHSIKFRKYYGDIVFNSVVKPKVDNIKLKYMREDEIDLFLSKLKEEDNKLDNDNQLGYLYGILALSIGAREQTILNIKKEDIDFENKWINLYNFKEDSTYTGHISHKELEVALKNITKINYKFIFHNIKTNKPYKKAPAIVRKTLDKYININKSEHSKITVRDLRNAFATRLINQGFSLAQIQKFLDHKTPDMTMRYARMLDETGGEELRKFFDKKN